MNFNLAKRTINRLFYIRTRVPYEKFLNTISQQDDAWVVSQGKYILWWQQRASSDLRINLSNKICQVETNLTNAVVEVFPNEFHTSPKLEIPCPNHKFDGPVFITIDAKLKQKELLKEALRREGILNYVEGDIGRFYLSIEVSLILEDMELALEQNDLQRFHQSIISIRQLIIERLAEMGVPLIRIWYHPCIEHRIIRVVVSPRHDVEREITNMPDILDLENKYQASSTVHLRTYCPFYNKIDIRKLIKHSACSEVALHGEFVSHSSRFGSILVAAESEKKELELITGHEILGVSLHGGELFKNNTAEAQAVIPRVGFLYNTSRGPYPYYFPYKCQKDNGTFETTYQINTNFGDIRIPYSKQYSSDFYNEALRKVEIAYAEGGILVMMLHPLFFNPASYLFNIKNLVKLLFFLPIYFYRLIKVIRNTG